VKNPESYRTIGRIIELCFCFLAALVVLVFLSFFSLRPLLVEFRTAAENEWAEYAEFVSKRNQLLPGVAEALRSFESGHAKLVNRLLQAPAVSLHHRSTEFIAAFGDDVGLSLLEVDKLAKSKPQLEKYPPFEANWQNVRLLSRQIGEKRIGYNTTAAAYNGLLKAFPQNLVCAALGFVPLVIYPVNIGASFAH
jgi:hypothetical protein